MLRVMEMFGGVLAGGRVATTNVPAREALPEVDPGIAHLEALFATIGAGLYVLDLVEMRYLVSRLSALLSDR